jgi:hypothetical protein
LLVFDARQNELAEQSRSNRFATPETTATRPQPKVGYQGPARQLQGHPLPASLIGNNCYSLGRVDESDIADSEFRSLIILN